MNKDRRAALAKIASELDDLQSQIETAKDEEATNYLEEAQNAG